MAQYKVVAKSEPKPKPVTEEPKKAEPKVAPPKKRFSRKPRRSS